MVSWVEAPDVAVQCAVVRDGDVLFDIAAGTDPFTGAAVTRESLFILLSASKGIATLALLTLREQELFEWDSPIVTWWPEFGGDGAGGKAAATVEHLMSHRLGLAHVTAEPQRWTDRDYMRTLVETAAPGWRPGESYGYHGGCWGFIVDELCRRWTRATVGDALRRLVSALPPAARRVWLGLPRDEERDVVRVSFVADARQENSGKPEFVGIDRPPYGRFGAYNSIDVLASCQPSGGAVGNARSVAMLYSVLAACGRLPSGGTAWSPAVQAFAQLPRNLPHESPAARPELRFSWGLGFQVAPSRDIFGSRPLSPLAAGHAGASGSVAYGDPVYRFGVALLVNGMGGRAQYVRYRQLGDALREVTALRRYW